MPEHPAPLPEPVLDLRAYLDRVGFPGPLTPDLRTLEALHAAHTAAIPFENLDIHLGRPILLDLASLQAKLVAGRRGGYCFEHNSLFAAVLRRLGFAVKLREARVRRGAERPLPRTHLAVEVTLQGGSWLADVGFGGDGILGPVPMDGREQARFGDRHRVVPEGSRQVLQVLEAGAWADLYALEPGEPLPIDLVVANHYTSTHPDSRFTRTLTAQRCVPGERSFLRDRTFTIVREQGTEVREVGDEERLALLAERFGLQLPPGTRLP